MPRVSAYPMVRVSEEVLGQIRRGTRPAYAALPALPEGFAVDLDRIMTVEKAVAAAWKRTPGFVLDSDARAFAQALARKRARFAFPDDFNDLAGKLQRRLFDKHEKNTPEGRGLRALREIRVQASPAWDGPEVALFFWFIRYDVHVDFEGKSWADLRAAWLNLVKKGGRFSEVEGQVATLEDLSGADYVNSDPLDLDHLSSKGSPE